MDGRVVALQLTDEGAGYRDTDRVMVAIAPPPVARNGAAPSRPATAKVRVIT